MVVVGVVGGACNDRVVAGRRVQGRIRDDRFTTRIASGNCLELKVEDIGYLQSPASAIGLEADRDLAHPEPFSDQWSNVRPEAARLTREDFVECLRLLRSSAPIEVERRAPLRAGEHVAGRMEDGGDAQPV